MEMTIQCPSCQSRLRVPQNASGRSARCIQCRTKFRIPDFNAILEDTVTGWLVDEDVGPEQVGSPPDEKEAEAASEPSIADSTTRAASNVTTPPASPVPPQAPPPLSDAPDDDAVPPVEPKAPAARSDAREQSKKTAVEPRVPSSVPRDHIHLVVRDVNTAAVSLAFHSRLLERPAFRMSMPLCCLACQKTDPGQLIARPLAWIDRAGGKFASVTEIETSHEIHVQASQVAGDVVQLMRPIPGLPPPFNSPVPYFVCTQCANRVKVDCKTTRDEGGITCEVRLPTGPYALAWLGRVNGVCGDEYTQLEARLKLYEDEAWRRTDSVVRHRLTAWFDFEPDERFLKYLSDADVLKNQAGAAGMVVTDQRLVYCKSHRRGSLQLADPAELHIVKDGPFYDVIYHHEGHKRNLVRLRAQDSHELIQVLDELDTQLRVLLASKS